MPLIKKSSYESPWWLKNAHLATIIPNILRKVEGINYKRERIDTHDKDFIDLDWLKTGNRRLVILLHGLEGSSDRGYMKGMAKYFNERDWDIVAYNCRGCSGEINRQPRLYHHGDTDDVSHVVDYINKENDYSEIVMMGFSMGGSLILNYLGNQKHVIPENIKAVVTFSVPCDLKATAEELSRKGRGFYRKRFLKKLTTKIQQKAKQFPKVINIEDLHEVKNFFDFETKYTAPLHGFENANAFYEYASAGNYLENIKIPTLIVNAANDPLFSEACYPIRQAKKSSTVYLEIPKHGGHVGFSLSKLYLNWMEQRAWQFLDDL